MENINIEINRAKLTYFTVNIMDDGALPRVYAQIDLLSGNKKISEFTIDSDTYQNERKFDVPTGMIKPILKLAKELETIVTLKCSAAIGQITDGKK